MTKKLISFMLALVLIIVPLASCGKKAPENNTENEEKIVIASAEGTEYCILLSSELVSGEKIQIKTMVDELKKKYGVDIELRLPSRNDEELPEACEILVGRANRSEAEAAYSALRHGEFSIGYNETSGRITVVGSSGELSVEALKYFFENYFDKEGCVLSIPADLSYHYTVDYPYDKIMINGVDVREYVIVVPSLDDVFSYYTALNIADYVMYKTGVAPRIADDDEGTYEYEILIGDTNRSEDDLSHELAEREYAYAVIHNKLVLRGYGVYVGAGFGEAVARELDGNKNAPVASLSGLPEKLSVKKYSSPESAESVILMIGDGMGLNHIEAAMYEVIECFEAESFTSEGRSVTRSLSVIRGNASVTDSAAAATAMATGTKTINGYIGKDGAGKDLQNVRELADEYGARTAVVTTDAITGATPAAFLAHNISRKNTDKINDEIRALIDNGKIEYCAGSVGDFITQHTRAALGAIAYAETPFFMMVEEGRIDSYSHSGNLEKSLDALGCFNDSVIYAACFVMTNGNTALIVTADHETGGLTEDAASEVGYSYTTEEHTNVDVGIWALGGGTDVFDGATVENTEIYEFIASHYGAK